MKLKYFIFCSIYLLSSCSKSKDENKDPIVGKWHLVSQLVDPGDGSGTFHDVSSNRTIDIDENGVVTSNGNLCDLGIGTESESQGQYSFQDKVLLVNGCSFPYNLPVTLEGEFIDVHYPCFEACICKYKKEVSMKICCNVLKTKMANHILIAFCLTLSGLVLGCTKNNCVEVPKDDCICDTQYDPVCGCNGITYGNSCEAICANINEFTPGVCPQ